jgi:hypothetical protein
VTADAKYGNLHFLDALKDQPCGTVVRLRKDRVRFRTKLLGASTKLNPPSQHHLDAS